MTRNRPGTAPDTAGPSCAVATGRDLGHAGGVPEHPLEELPLYLEDGAARRPGPPAPKVTARDVASRVSAWVGDLVDGDGSMAAPSSLDPMMESAKDDVVVIHRVLGDPAALLTAFDGRWGREPSRLGVALGTLQLDRATAVTAGRRALPGQLRLRWSFRPLPVELEAVPWHTYGLVISLRPARHGTTALGWHRRWAWFAAGHRLLDQMRRTLEATGR